MPMKPSRIGALVEKHEQMRSRGINLVVSENTLSRAARQALASDLAGRYHAAWYGGSAVAREIVSATEALSRTVFRARHALVLAQSGNLCDLTVLLALTEPGDAVAMLPFEGGGYPLGVEKFHRRLVHLPVRPSSLAVDANEARALLARERPRLVLLAASFNVFPQPVRELRAALAETGTECTFVYDGSHVLGLIACGAFQDPLREGADVLIGSTHKTFFGPQGGIIVTDSDALAKRLNAYLELDVTGGIGLVDNPHLGRIAALGIAMEEMLADPGYGGRVIENARALAGALAREGVPVRFADRGFTASHQVLLDLDDKRAETLCHQLEGLGILIDIGARIGVAEATRRGMDPQAMEAIASVVAQVYRTGPDERLAPRISALAESASRAGAGPPGEGSGPG